MIIVLRAIDDDGRKLAQPIPDPLTTNHVRWIGVQENYGGAYCEVELTNGWRFLYAEDEVCSFGASNWLFSNPGPILIKDYEGKWNMTESQAIELVRKTLAKLTSPTNMPYINSYPSHVIKPSVPGIPRYMFAWTNWIVSAEVDADKRESKALYYGSVVSGGQRPQIDVPLLLPLPEKTNADFPGKDSLPIKSTPLRPFVPFPSPQK